MESVAIIAAAGKGERFGSELPKQYLILRDKPILVHTLLVFEESGVDEIILVVDEGRIQFCQDEIIDRYHLRKVKRIVSGGRHRQESVYNGFKVIEEDPLKVVIIHDGIRPFVTCRLIEEVVQEASRSGAAITAVRVKDTVKLANREMNIERTIERENLWLAQTPQAFKYGLLKEGFEEAFRSRFFGTDEAILIERLNHRVKIVRGREDNIKITTKEDLILAEAILESRYETLQYPYKKER